jgi:hypothetical protein
MLRGRQLYSRDTAVSSCALHMIRAKPGRQQKGGWVCVDDDLVSDPSVVYIVSTRCYVYTYSISSIFPMGFQTNTSDIFVLKTGNKRD